MLQDLAIWVNLDVAPDLTSLYCLLAAVFLSLIRIILLKRLEQTGD